jgi:MarR family transcriptional regulator, organic hydroperoxide resistance regulator
MTEAGVRETGPGEDGDGLNCLMVQTSRGYRVLLAGLLGEIDLYPGQERVMAAIWENGPQSQNALARIVGIDVSTMTKSLQRLERSGFVRRSPCPTNRRVSIVDTTPEGDALRPRIDRVLSEVHARMTRGLTPEQTDQLCSLLGVVRGNICREAEPGAGPAGPSPLTGC